MLTETTQSHGKITLKGLENYQYYTTSREALIALIKSTFQPTSNMTCHIKVLTTDLVSPKDLFLLTYEDQKYVIKALTAKNRFVKISEMLAMTLASNLNIAPRFINASENLALRQFVEADFKAFDQSKGSTIKLLANMLKNIHRINPQEYGVIFSRTHKYFQQILDNALKLSDKHQHLRQLKITVRLFELIEKILEPYKQTICHYDLHPWNILFDTESKTIRAIDWECVCWGDPLYDIACIAVYFRLTPKQESHLLKLSFEGTIDKEACCRYLLNKARVYIYFSLAYIGFAKKHSPELLQAENIDHSPFRECKRPLSEISITNLDARELHQMHIYFLQSAHELSTTHGLAKAMLYIISKNLSFYSPLNAVANAPTMPADEYENLLQMKKSVNFAEPQTYYFIISNLITDILEPASPEKNKRTALRALTIMLRDIKNAHGIVLQSKSHTLLTLKQRSPAMLFNRAPEEKSKPDTLSTSHDSSSRPPG